MPEFLILTEILKNLIFLKPAFSLAVSCISIFVIFILIKVPFSQKFYKVELDKNRSNFTKDLQKIEQNKVGIHKIEKASALTSKLLNTQKRSMTPKNILFFLLPLVLIFPSFLIYLNVGYIGFPDHYSHNLKAEKTNFSDKPSQKTATLFFKQIENKIEKSDESSQTRLYRDAISELKKSLDAQPQNLKILKLLTHYNSQIHSFSEAAITQERVIEVLKNKATISEYSLLLELLVKAAKGYVSPKSKTVLNLILKFNNMDQTANLFNAHFFAQSGEFEKAEKIWQSLLTFYKGDKKLLKTIQEAKLQYSLE